MRQTEIFPILEDQKLIDDYISYQNALISWKKTNLKTQKSLIYANEVLNRTKCNKTTSEIEKRGFVNKLYTLIKELEHELSKSQMHINICKEMIGEYGIYFSCKDEYEYLW